MDNPLDFMKFQFLIPLLCLPCLLHAQNQQFGIIYPIASEEASYCCTYFPNDQALDLYDAPNGRKLGVVARKDVDDAGYEDQYTLVFIDGAGDSTQLDMWQDLKEVGYEAYALTYTAHQDGFVKVLPSLGDRWIKVIDLQQVNFRQLPFQSFMTEKSGEVLGFYPEAALNLRKSPSPTAEKIETMSFQHEISLTGKHEGPWSHVKVIKLKEGRCEGNEDVEEYELEGWIKVLDDSGTLNIWFYTRGC